MSAFLNADFQKNYIKNMNEKFISQASGSTLDYEHTNVKPKRKKVSVAEPRGFWWEFAISCATFNIYNCFWLVRRTAEINRMGQRRFSPVWWFFVPLIIFAPLIAFPRFFKALGALESKYSIKSKFNSDFESLWTLLLFLFGVANALSFKFDWPLYIDIINVIVGALLFATLQVRINVLKHGASEELHFVGRKDNYRWYEWLSVALFILLLALIALLRPWGDEDAIGIVDELEPAYILKSNEHGFSLSFDESNAANNIKRQWNSLKIGSYSDGSALYEFGNQRNSVHMLIFDHGDSDSFNSIMSFRFNDTDRNFNYPPICDEQRYLVSSGNAVNALLTCNSRVGNYHLSTRSLLIEVEDKIYELFIYHYDTPGVFRKMEVRLLEIANSFRASKIDLKEASLEQPLTKVM